MPARAAVQTADAEAQDSKERILAAALEAFSELGFDGATTREIAQRAEVNLGLIQYYFGGKENLWRASVERAFAEIGAAVADSTADGVDPRERARRTIRGFVEFVARRPAFVRIMQDEGKRDGPRMRWLVDQHVRGLFAGTQEMLRATGALAPSTPEADAVSLHYVLVGALTLFFHQAEECKYLTGVDPQDPAVVEAHIRTLERLLLGPAPQEVPS